MFLDASLTSVLNPLEEFQQALKYFDNYYEEFDEVGFSNQEIGDVKQHTNSSQQQLAELEKTQNLLTFSTFSASQYTTFHLNLEQLAINNENNIKIIEQQEQQQQEDILMIRRVFITPLRICARPAENDLSNRILRQFIQFKNRFLRITFVDENFAKVFSLTSSEDIFENRFRVLILNGFELSGKTFKFLGYSNSQLREQSCWFYDEHPEPYADETLNKKNNNLNNTYSIPSADFIRNWIGDLTGITSIG
jgi:hypothetical protein